ncbi:hypothetical protein ACFP3U_01790 [Kitasatospora misakiensis]|uniref:Thioredoxin domain-containing protein n=1 Tax=Kitasatospora misakiensis TaxID=67330 RepID=A0ABW0WXQ8_9ACTN
MSLGLSVLGLVLGLFNLLLLYGVIRRLKEIEARPRTAAAPARPTGITDAHRLTAGTVLDIPDGSRPTLVAFFAPGCAPCEELLPLVAGHAAQEPGGRDRVLAVLSDGTPEDNARFAQALDPVARVVVGGPKDPHITPWTDVFRVDGLPLVCGLDDTAAGMAISWSAVSMPELIAKAGIKPQPVA